MARLVSTLTAMVLVLVACGQKPGVHVATTEIVSGQTTGGTATEGTEEGEVTLGLGEEAAGGGSTTTTRRTGGGGTTGGGTTGGGSADVQPGPGDKNGITSSAIKVGFHAPLTGAAAVPLTQLEAGVNIYRNFLEANGVKVHGRKIDTIFRDDQYNPSHATEVCRELVEREQVFLLVGGAGTDQIVACARYAQQRGVPYLSAGVTENIVKTLPNYFAFTMSYPQQTKLVAQVIKDYDAPLPGGKVYANRCDPSDSATETHCSNTSPGDPKVAVVFSDTDGFYDARDSFARDWRSVSGRDVDHRYQVNKSVVSSDEASALIQRMKGDGVDVAFVLTSPTNWLTIMDQAERQRYAPRWVGVGLTMGVNVVASAGCTPRYRNNFQNSLFWNPWMSVDDNEYSQTFKQAWANNGGDPSTPPDEADIAFGLWGGTIVQHAMFEAAGRDLGRAKFINTIRDLKNVKAPTSATAKGVKDIYSVINYSPNSRFGASQAHLLYGDCSGAGRWRTVENNRFKSNFP